MNGKAIVEETRTMAVSLPLDQTESDAQHQQRLRSIDAEAFGRMLLGRRRTLEAYANMLTGNRSAADDLVQDTFERALRAKGQFKAGSNLTAWLRRIMRNLFTDRCRQGTRFISMTDQEFAEPSASETPLDHPPEIDFCDFVTIADVKAALEAIERPSRELFVMAHMKRQSYQKIATDLGIPVSTVGTRLYRARARIRHILASSVLPMPAGVTCSSAAEARGRA